MVTSYLPESSEGTLQLPVPLVTTVVDTPVATFFTATLAPGIPPPVESFTNPVSADLVVCANAIGAARQMISTANHSLDKTAFMPPPNLLTTLDLAVQRNRLGFRQCGHTHTQGKRMLTPCNVLCQHRAVEWRIRGPKAYSDAHDHDECPDFATPGGCPGPRARRLDRGTGRQTAGTHRRRW